MRAELSTIHQTLSPEAAKALAVSVAEAARRGHGRTTPLHVASTLLSSPSGLLRRACLRSHPASAHPLQCRALELCFTVALDRLPAAPASPPPEPPMSNALMAALKRAQAHQRRGFPESQQPPLLAVKVELEQFVIAILDDPGVSRVMREAGFSSPPVKAVIEASLSPAAVVPDSPSPPPPPRGFNLTVQRQQLNNLYINPKLQSPHHPPWSGGAAAAIAGVGKTGEVKRVVEVLLRAKKRNPILVGDSQPETILREVVDRIERREIAGVDAGVIVSVEQHLKLGHRGQIGSKIRELGDLIASQIGDGVIIDLGNMKWLAVDGSGGGTAEAVVEMGRLLKRLAGGAVWLVGTASCATYLRCQVYHPTMEREWDLQAVPIVSRIGSNKILFDSRGPVQSLPATPVPLPQRRSPEIADASLEALLCPLCMKSYEKELAKLAAEEFKASSSISNPETLQNQWLRISVIGAVGKPEPNRKQNAEELLKRWRDTCASLHGKPLLALSLKKPFSLSRSASPPASPVSSPRSPVMTDLALGRSKVADTHKQTDDFDTFKRLSTGLSEEVSWQPEAASGIIDALMQARSSTTKLRGDTWFLFAGPDRVGQKKMASALSQLLFGASPFTVGFREPDVNLRGRRPVDCIVEAIRRNPYSVVVLEDMDLADVVVRKSIKSAMEQGRLADSYGREASVGNVIFIFLTDHLPDEITPPHKEKFALELSVGRRSTAKRRPDWHCRGEKKPVKPKKESLGLSLDLNLALGVVTEDSGDGSLNASDLTTEHEHDETGHVVKSFTFPLELMDSVDFTVAFKPVDSLGRRISEPMAPKFVARRSVSANDDDDDGGAVVRSSSSKVGERGSDWLQTAAIVAANGLGA